MPTNLEIKAACPSVAKAKDVARAIGARYFGTLLQTDTYFRVRSGRLKLREIDGKQFELIFYRRANEKKIRYSEYIVLPLLDIRSAMPLFRSLYSVSAVVQKKRALFLYKNARIHIDSVNGLGAFIEFEVIVNRGRKQARSLMQFLRRVFQIDPATLVAGSYGDMVLKKN